jgi:hypothetical protein
LSKRSSPKSAASSVRAQENRLAGSDVSGVSSPGGVDHLPVPVDGGHASGSESSAHQVDGDAVAGPELEHPVVGLDAELLDRSYQPLRDSAPHASSVLASPAGERARALL